MRTVIFPWCAQPALRGMHGPVRDWLALGTSPATLFLGWRVLWPFYDKVFRARERRCFDLEPSPLSSLSPLPSSLSVVRWSPSLGGRFFFQFLGLAQEQLAGDSLMRM